jgi:hypothetical protein
MASYYQMLANNRARKFKNGGSDEDYYNYYQGMAEDRYTSMLDYSSPMYKQYANYLQTSTPKAGTDTYMSMLTAGGGGYAGNMKIAAAKAKNDNAQRNDSILNAVNQFAASNSSQANNLLSMMSSNQMNKMQLTAQREAQNESFGDILGGLIGMVGGSFLGGLGSGYANKITGS